MKLIEALKNLKTIEKRVAKNCAQIADYAAFVSADAPMFVTQEAQTQEVKSLVQANLDLEIEYLRLKHAIETTNLGTQVSIDGRTYSISELIAIRRGVKNFRLQTYAALNTGKASKRCQEVYHKGIDASNPPRILICYTEADKNAAVRDWESFIDAIDGRLEVVNAETDLLGY